MANIRSYRELRVYQMAFEAAMEIYELTKSSPSEEKYSMTDQMRRSSRSVCSNIGEAWRKRRYPAHWCSKLSDAESEAEETRVFLQFAVRCGYIAQETGERLDQTYDSVLAQLVNMSTNADKGTIRRS